MSDKTYAELARATDLQDGDLLASFRGASGPLKAFTFSLLVSTVSTELSGNFLLQSQNLNDLPDKAQSRLNLGLGNAAVANVGQNTGQVAAGDDNRITGALQRSGGALTGQITQAGAGGYLFNQTGSGGQVYSSTSAAPTTGSFNDGDWWAQYT